MLVDPSQEAIYHLPCIMESLPKSFHLEKELCLYTKSIYLPSYLLVFPHSVVSFNGKASILNAKTFYQMSMLNRLETKSLKEVINH